MDEREKFRVLALDIVPLLKQMEAVLEAHEVDCYTRVAMDKNGYFEFGHQNTPWEMRRLDTDHPINIICEIKEEL